MNILVYSKKKALRAAYAEALCPRMLNGEPTYVAQTATKANLVVYATMASLLLVCTENPQDPVFAVLESSTQKGLRFPVLVCGENAACAAPAARVGAQYAPYAPTDARLPVLVQKLVPKPGKDTEETLQCNKGRAIYRVPLAQIEYIQAEKRACTVFYGKKQLTFYTTMQSLAARLEDKGFVQIHRAYLVQARAIQTVHTGSVVLNTGQTLPVSKGRQPVVNAIVAQT